MDYKRRFAGVAGAEYELFRLAVPHHDRFQELLAESVSKLAEQLEHDVLRVLDLGCGYGYTSLLLHAQNPDLEIEAIDNEAIVTDKAREYLSDEITTGKIKVTTSDAVEFLKSQDDSSVDAVVSAWVFHNWDHDYRERALRETFRVLKNGGIFVNADKYAWDDGDRQTQALYWQIEKFFDAYLPMKRTDALREWVLHYVLDEAPKIQMKEKVAFSLMTEIGFSELTVLRREQMELVLCATKES